MSNTQKPGTAAQQGRVWFPFSDQTPWRPSVPTPWLGGVIVPLAPTGLVAHGNANLAVAHGLNRKPRFCLVLDAWTNVNVTQPIPRATGASTGWNSTNAYLNMPSISAPVTLFFA